MAEAVKSLRIAAVAKELNVGISHLVDHLNEKGFEVENKPTTKLTEEMYQVLIKHFQQDLLDKQRADKVHLGVKAADEPEVKKETPAETRKKDETPKELLIKNIVTKTPEKPVKEEKPEEAITRVKTEKIAGPKVVGSVNLEELKTDKKAGKKKATKKKKGEEEEEEVKPETTEAVTEVITETEQPKETPSEEPPAPDIKTEYGKLSGPKVVGSIDLSSIKSKGPDYSDIIKSAEQDNRKRKRIVRPERIQIEDIERADKLKKPPFKGPERGKKKSGPGGGKRHEDKNAAPEVSQKEIEEKIKETMARLSPSGKGKSAKSKYRRLKREGAAEAAEGEVDDSKILQVTEFISVAELASLMGAAVTDVIKKCLDLGVMVSINQRLDAEIIELVSSEFGYQVEFISVEEQAEMEDEEEEDTPEMLKPRAPIVTIMGHVDHGKTSLLDYIREANVVAGEVGGITQHIGAYEVTVKGDKKITFLDTPGHEAFTAMRARGAKITDIAVIVIAADDAVMPQTREAISHAQAANVPMIFAINKIDKPGANTQKIKEQLANMNLLVEDWGGKFQSQEISAKSGLNVDLLLEKILLEAEVLELKANPDKAASGNVIEAALDKGRGYVATLLVQQGTLKLGDILVAGSNYGRVKAMFDERTKKLKDAGPSMPALILGMDGAPQAGEKFKVFESEQDAKELANKRQQIIREQGIRTKKHITLDEIGRRLALGNFKELNVIIKGDFDGSVEALTDSLLKLSTPEIQVSIVHRGVGQITESDVLLASASDAIIIGFNVRPSSSARKLAEKENIEIRLYSIIYNAIEELKSAMEGMLEPKVEEKIVGNIEVRDVFKVTKVGTVAGCYVTEGKVTRQTKVRLIRDGIVIYSGEMASLKRFKDDVKEVTSGMECGIAIKNFNDIKTGDVIEGYEETEVKRTL
jgi:translation initiation factor IF-2